MAQSISNNNKDGINMMEEEIEEVHIEEQNNLNMRCENEDVIIDREEVVISDREIGKFCF